MASLFSVTIFCFSYYAVQALLDAPQDLVINLDKKCIERYNLTTEIVEKYTSGQMEYYDDLGKEAWCLLRSLGVMDEDGNLLKDKLEEKIKAERGDNAEAKNIIETCETEDVTPEKTADKVLLCLYKNRKEGELFW